MKLDEIDLRIVQVLQNNARIPVLDLAELVGLSATPCSRRLRRLEDEAIIKKYVAVLNPRFMNLDITAFLSVRAKHAPELIAKFKAAILRMPNIRGCYAVTGDYDYLLWVNAKDMQSFSRWILEEVHKLPSVLHTHTSVVLESIKDEPSFLLRDLSALKDQSAGRATISS
jgi:Lrp/AsnC family transcriptional regulator, leucine-responsive regulatory protein